MQNNCRNDHNPFCPRGFPTFPLPLAASILLLGAGLAAGQTDRRDRQDPELILETGGRLGACDYLTFTNDGRHLLAVGDDKVVRCWDDVAGKLTPSPVPVLRWSTWREQRGAIFALALSPDKDNRRVAIGGLGPLTTTVAVLDRTTGKVLHATTPLLRKENFGAVQAVAFSPSGNLLAYGTASGSVWLWDFKANRLLGRHSRQEEFNRVRLIHFLDEKMLLTVAESGEVWQWDLQADQPAPTPLPAMKASRTLYRATLSPDGQWLAVAPRAPLVTLRSLDGSRQKDIPLPEGQFARSLAFDPKGNRLIVGIGSLVQGSRFYLEADDRLVFYDLDQSPPTASPGPPHSYRAEFLAFHPDGRYLAVAGGDNQEVTLWDLNHPTSPASVMHGTGTCLWDVALSESGNQLGFKDRRNPDSRDIEDRGRGPWRVFDLMKRKWVEPGDFKPVPRLTSAGGWHVEPDETNPYVWYAVDAGGSRFALPMDKDRDLMPRCYAFLKAEKDQPVRVVVGHSWGLSVFALTEQGARRVRYCTGHQGDVVALGVAVDQTWMVSASSDQTVDAWTLAPDWPSQAQLGARFDLKDGALKVATVDVGSPAWEAGLVEGDTVTRLDVAAKPVPGGPEAWVERLRAPVPGLEHYFELQRDGQPVKLLTTVRQRPLWRFFPTREGEWVLWMWRNSFYDTSTRGDSSIGWHVNSVNLDREPAFYPAEHFRNLLQRADVIDKLLETRDVGLALKESVANDNPVPLRFDAMEPPSVSLKVAPLAGAGQDVEATLAATPHGDSPDHQPRRAELWVNDFRLATWDNVLTDWQPVGKSYRQVVPVPGDKLRAGRNLLTFQTYNRLGGRSDVQAEVFCQRQAPPAPQLVGMAVGINDYSANKPAPDGKRAFGNLNSARKDAEEMRKTWDSQPLFSKRDMFLRLDGQADREALVQALDKLAREANPDDLCVLFLAGHGMFVKQGKQGRPTFVFCCSTFDPSHPEETGLSRQTLFEKLAAIPCRKLVILDACRSGEAAAASTVRNLTPGGQGPLVLAGCDRTQSSYENPSFGHGLFTYAILEALEGRLDKADRERFTTPLPGGDRLLSAGQLVAYTKKRMPELLRQIKYPGGLQVPVSNFESRRENYPVARLAAEK